MAAAEGLMRFPIFIKRYCLVVRVAIIAVLAQALIGWAQDQEIILRADPAQSGAEITLGGNFHDVEGSFAFKSGTIHYHPATSAASGEIVFDATSGKTGNSSRDNKMHKDIIESGSYPEISFRPERAEGTLAASGESTLQLHGRFAIHGAEHEITIPVRVNVHENAWTATADFPVPYVSWGMKNPSKLFLRVDSGVKVHFHAAGSLTRGPG